MLSLQCAAQCYEWGRPANASEVAQLARANGSDIDSNKPYAELWMGTHPNCPSRVQGTGQPLSEWIEQHPASVGHEVPRRFGFNLPFLFKVLSVNKALSIQSHPDKQLAEKLHQQFPKMYPDDNHKPEMALAISNDFEALCGFAPIPTIVSALQSHPELLGLVGQDSITALTAATQEETQVQALQSAFTNLMTAPVEAVQTAVSSLVQRLSSASGPLSPTDQLALRLNTQYPGGDVGVLASFFLNYVTLRSGQALYLGANEPHAYLAGELVECMASSDNVIRAGLTPKFKHADVLCQSLTYRTGLPEVLEGDSVAATTRVYRPPTEEFEIRCVTLAPGAIHTLPADAGPQLLLVQSGRGEAAAAGGMAPTPQNQLLSRASLTRGQVLFTPAGTSLTLSCSEPLVIWVAAVNRIFFQLSDAISSPMGKPVPAAVESTNLSLNVTAVAVP